MAVLFQRSPRGLLALALAGAGFLAPGPLGANEVAEACRLAGRAAATPELCACIGVAADLSLSPRDQARAASFFADPQAAQEARQSDRRRDEAFWMRYRDFIQTAEDICGAIRS